MHGQERDLLFFCFSSFKAGSDMSTLICHTKGAVEDTRERGLTEGTRALL